MNNKHNITFNEIIPREERHYCAHLFASLLYYDGAIKNFFSCHTNIDDNYRNLNFKHVKMFYEYTALREHLYKIRNNKKDYQFEKERIENLIFKNTSGDIQKKKPDLAFHFKKEKILVLIEAKFEGSFKTKQIEETQRYGEVLKGYYPEQIEKVWTSLLGLDYYLKDISTYPKVTWEEIHKRTTDHILKKEIESGLNFQKMIHPRTLKNWNK